ncbi:MAG TPA: S8/S53 family peptidase [Symbiobacteriaceae bacterium]|nr:S8/S53 family peptidase [Symbiobacteriaceae bacterium]
MMIRKRLLLAVAAVALTLIFASCSEPAATPATPGVERPTLSRTPPPADYSFMGRQPLSLTKPTDSSNPFAVDLRHRNLTDQKLADAGDVLLGYASFDTATRWPSSLPAGFDPARLMDLGKDPGLGLRELHRQGITGKGIRVAFLDQTLLVDHAEYKDRIERYGEIGAVPNQAQMHAPAVLSLLAGKTVGAAPGVAVTFYAVDHLDGDKVTWINHAKAIHEILDENAKLPVEQRIRVIGVSLGYSPDWGGYDEIKAAVARAKKEGVFVLTTSVETDYTFKFNGLGREPLSDPNQVNSYRPGAFWAARFYQQPDMFTDRIMVPMDSRTAAGPCSQSEYAFYRQGGWSWAVPYLEGVYAMGLQVKPDLTPEEFYRVALETGSYSEYTENGKAFRLGPILNPAALIKKLQGG